MASLTGPLDDGTLPVTSAMSRQPLRRLLCVLIASVVESRKFWSRIHEKRVEIAWQRITMGAEPHSLQSHSTIKRGRPQWPLPAATNDDHPSRRLFQHQTERRRPGRLGTLTCARHSLDCRGHRVAGSDSSWSSHRSSRARQNYPTTRPILRITIV
jgi:hypothetical protein